MGQRKEKSLFSQSLSLSLCLSGPESGWGNTVGELQFHSATSAALKSRSIAEIFWWYNRYDLHDQNGSVARQWQAEAGLLVTELLLEEKV